MATASNELQNATRLARIRKSHELAMRAAEDLGKELDTLILGTPTGENRNKVCDANIRLAQLKANLKEFKVP